MGQGSDSRRSIALELERLARVKAAEEINGETRRAEEDVVRDCQDRGILHSGIFCGRIADVHRERAKRIVDKHIELRRATLEKAPEVASEQDFKELLEAAFRTIDGVLRAIPEHLKRYGLQIPTQTAHQNDGLEAVHLEAHARREIEMLKREHALRVIQKEKEEHLSNSKAKDNRKVWVVHGRNLKARDAMFIFLRSIGLEPMEWGEALALTGKGTPYTGEVLDLAFAEAQVVVVLITGDELARLGTRFAYAGDPPAETDPTPQARPNVLFEAGMAFGKFPERTVLVHLGETRPFSDVAGRNVLYISNGIKERQALADRLRISGAAVTTENRADWHAAGDFDSANEPPDFPCSDPGPTPSPGPATSRQIPQPQPLPRLSEGARDLLIEAAQDKNGMIMSLPTMGGRIIQTNDRGFVESGDPRSEARWKGAVDELHRLSLIEDRGHKGEAFAVTEDGYRVADDLRQH
jgi:predicted nucleotide-binding protein